MSPTTTPGNQDAAQGSTSSTTPTTGAPNQDRTQQPASAVTVPPVTEVPSDLKSGEGRELVIDQPSMFGVNQFAVYFTNGIVYTVSRYLGGEPIDMTSLLAAAEYQETNVPSVSNIEKRTITQLGESGIQVKGELNNTPTPTFSVAYVCLLNGGAYTSLSACTGS